MKYANGQEAAPGLENFIGGTFNTAETLTSDLNTYIGCLCMPNEIDGSALNNDLFEVVEIQHLYDGSLAFRCVSLCHDKHRFGRPYRPNAVTFLHNMSDEELDFAECRTMVCDAEIGAINKALQEASDEEWEELLEDEREIERLLDDDDFIS
jgi:hypothetical protein